MRSTQFEIGARAAKRRISVRQRDGSTPGLFWLGGFRSVMVGAKATALDALGARRGQSVTRFDYSGCGDSTGRIEDGTISRWLEEAVAVFEGFTTGQQVVIGSSMGGWLALLMNRHLRARGIHRVRALVLIAPAVDMTENLMRQTFTAPELAALQNSGRMTRRSAYADEPTVLTRELIEDGASHLLFTNAIATGCPVHILHGVKDVDVPHTHALKLASHLLHDETFLTLVPDGDHRLSRESDLQMLARIVDRAAAVQ